MQHIFPIPELNFPFDSDEIEWSTKVDNNGILIYIEYYNAWTESNFGIRIKDSSHPDFVEENIYDMEFVNNLIQEFSSPNFEVKIRMNVLESPMTMETNIEGHFEHQEHIISFVVIQHTTKADF